MSCELAHEDAAYVLGALAPTERHVFEAHLPTCAECTQAVRELAGLPGLLSLARPEVAGAGTENRGREPVPGELLPQLVLRVRRAQRRQTILVAALAAAAAVVVSAGVIGLVARDQPDTAPAPPVAAAQPMLPVVPELAEPMVANLSLTGVPWGTRLRLTCTYPADDSRGASATATYALVVRTRSGTVQRVATWRPLPGRTMQLDAATAVDPAGIASVEVRDADGAPVMRLRG